MKTLLILGAGTAGTIMASTLRNKLPKGVWTITLVDRAPDHYYQPGYLFMPFGIYTENDVRRPMTRTVPRGVDYREADVDRIDAAANRVLLPDGTEVPYDLLVTVPPNMGAEMIDRSGLGDELNYVPTDKHTLQCKAHANIFVIGDATDCPTSKAGSVAHFESEVLTENILHFIAGQPLRSRFDGHANCFIESGHGKAFLLDFNYDQEPVTGTFPFPALGPMRLLAESRLNHLGKMAFRWVYWNILLPGWPIPLVGHKMSLRGKKIPPKEMKAAA